jgi:signal peptidase I
MASLPKRLRKEAEEHIRISRRVYHFRRDVVEAEHMERQMQATAALSDTLKNKEASAKQVEEKLQYLQSILRLTGGKIYPRTFLSDNTDMLVVAAIVVLTIRTFFFQPFIIPTNSMFPTYNGMTFGVYSEERGEPNVGAKAFRRVVLGASHYALESDGRGEILIPVFNPVNRDGRIRFEYVQGRKWFGLLPAIYREYSLWVDGTRHTFRVPQEFNLDDIVHEVFFPDTPSLEVALNQVGRSNNFVQNRGILLARTGVTVAPGDDLIRFDIYSGDALFVDRFSYHFIQPGLGDPFVFRTRNIEGLRGPDGNLQDKYYIKRIGGIPGDTLQIREPVLYRNGEPEVSRPPFRRNAEREGNYRGYFALGQLAGGRQISLGPQEFYALGDNSGNSLDSRAFGPVPRSEIVGRAILIYYPFSRRWGLAQ